ncbi:MAG: acyltransferase [Verrucomicrobiaceae bacterium]|nr:acyltransferase [Verrucomicrobiaceae bacterium]
MFFVLSGFLITYLLLEEETKTGTISVRHFYVRRILRTWPLYFLVVALALFVWPVFFPIIAGEHTSAIRHSIAGLACYALLLPNLAAIFLHPLPFAGQTWSIGVEEQFYLVWPVLMKVFQTQNLDHSRHLRWLRPLIPRLFQLAEHAKCFDHR